MMVFKREIITKSVLTWLKYNNNWYFLLTSRNALFILVVLIASISNIKSNQSATKFASTLQDTCDQMSATDDGFV